MVEIFTTLKILLVGESGVGKSSLFSRIVNGSFNENQLATVGGDFNTKILTVDGKNVKLGIWDTAGQERYRAITPNYYKDAHGAILVYDISNSETFRKIEVWLNELSIYSTKPNMIKMIIGNKVDLQNREVTKNEGMILAKKHASMFIETSAKTNESVQTAFEELVQKILQTPDLYNSNDKSSFQLNVSDEEKSKFRCMGYKCF